MGRAQRGVPAAVVGWALVSLGVAMGGFPSSLRAATLTLPGEKPIVVTADQVEHIPADGLYRGEGSVVVTRGTMRLTADRIRFNAKAGRLKADGHVEFSDGLHRLRAPTLDFDLAQERGKVTDAQIFISREHYTITGKTMERQSATRYEINHATFTTCEVPEPGTDGCRPVWQFRARRVRLSLDDALTAQHVGLFLKGVPIAYLPILIVPVKDRQTGLLIPRIGSNSQEGLKIEQPFFWAITPNQDATATLDYRSEKGTGGAVEYRYLLGKVTGGEAYVSYFGDRQLGQDRMESRYHHTQWFSEAVEGRLNVNYVSHPTLFRELSESTTQRIQRSLESNAFVAGHWVKQHLVVSGRYTQDLEQPTDLTVQRLPEAGYSLLDLRTGSLPVFVSLDATAVQFYQQTIRPTVRLDAFPRAIARLRLHPGLTVTPRIGYRGTQYTRQAVSLDPVSRGVPVAGVGAESRLMARFPARRLTHLIEPSILYEYVPEVDQTTLRAFDEVDRLPSKNLVTYALANRLRLRGEELLTLTLTQSYRLHGPPSASDVRMQTMIRPWKPVALEVDSFYNLAGRRIAAFNTDLRVDNGPVSVSIGRRYTPAGQVSRKGDLFNPLSLGEDLTIPSPIQFVTGMAGARLRDDLTLSVQTYYDDAAQVMREAAYTLAFTRQCWGATLAYLHFPEKDQVSIQFTLKGLGGIGP